MPYSIVSGTCVPRTSLSHPELSTAFWNENSPVLSTAAMGTSHQDVLWITASGLSLRTKPSTSATSSGVQSSTLLRMATLQNSIWSTSRSTTVRSSSFGTSSPSNRVVTFMAPERMSFPKWKQSTTVTIVSSRATSESWL
eukprot:Amastigsp_a512187_17.p3 type:complete len:140 gc:universal Amastigsp_a512187_17:859-440(-)